MAGDAPAGPVALPIDGQVPPITPVTPPGPPAGQDPAHGADGEDKSELARVRQEAAANRVKAKETQKLVDELTAKLKGLEDANKTAEQKATEELTALREFKVKVEPQVQQLQLQLAVERAAYAAKITDTEAVWALVPKDGLTPDTATTAIEALVKLRPWIVDKQEPTPPVAPKLPAGNPDKGGKLSLTRDIINAMGTAEINARWSEIQDWLKANGG